MIKSAEVLDTNSCLSRAKSDEMLFVLLARDEAAPFAIREWCRERCRLQKNRWDDPQIKEALDCAEEMERQRALGQDSTTGKGSEPNV